MNPDSDKKMAAYAAISKEKISNMNYYLNIFWV